MATKDISDLQVCLAYAEMRRQMGLDTIEFYEPADKILANMTGQHPKVCWRAMKRALDHGLVNYGTTLRGG